jgi:ParB/RepB/Spo0J family partition protein
MPKLQNGNFARKISLSQIAESGNVRKDYRDIEELARSIKTSGLLQPIAVKSLGKDADGIERYELIAGHRRMRAFKALFDAGDGGFSMIDAVVVTGDKLALQLVENLQRSDLTARERESGIFEMTKSGKVSQREIAGWLGKTETYVSRNLRAHGIRETADREGIDTSGISTGALCEIAAAAGDDLPELLRRVTEEGGSVQAARKIGREYRSDTEAAEPETETSSRQGEWKVTSNYIDGKKIYGVYRIIDPTAIDHSGNRETHGDWFDTSDEAARLADSLNNPQQGRNDTTESEDGIYHKLDEKTEAAIRALEDEPNDIRSARKEPPTRKEGPSRLPPSWRDPVEFDPPHRDVDINDVLVIIKEYIDMAENRFAPAEANSRRDAAWDIIALLHEKL